MKHSKCGRAVYSECNADDDGSAYTHYLNTPPVGDAYSSPSEKAFFKTDGKAAI